MSTKELAEAAARTYLRQHLSPNASPNASPTRKVAASTGDIGAPGVPVLAASVANAKRWAEAVGCPTPHAVNAQIRADYGPTKTILLAEAWHDAQIVETANAVAQQRKATERLPTPLSLILIAGPSSSGKTTFCSKLSMHLRSLGVKPETLSTDDYFLARTDPRHPRDDSGALDFETIGAVDVEKLNADLKRLFKGEVVETPIFNFVIGAPETSITRTKRLAAGGVLVMEGIFCLNPALTPHIDRSTKFHIFIAPLSPLTLTDGSLIREDHLRLLRRVSRDYLHRGSSALHTIRKYASVRRGELLNIYPYAREAQRVYNSSLLYEAHVLKTMVEPLLLQIDPAEAGGVYGLVRDMLELLTTFESTEAKMVPNTSVLMEFIGKSVFEE